MTRTTTKKCLIFLEHQSLPESYPFPFPGLTGYVAEIADVNMQDFWHVGFLGPRNLVPEEGSSEWDASRALSWVALAISEESKEEMMEIMGVIDNSATALRVSARKDLESHPWPLDQSLDALSALALTEREALKMDSTLSPASQASLSSPRI